MANEATSPDSIAVAERVRELMSRHGIGKRQQTTELCRILDLSFSQGHRKLRGNSPWTLSQIKKVAEAFGEPAAQLFGAQSLDPGMVGAIAQEAVFSVGALDLACTAWVGAPLEAGSRPDFVAYSKLGQWRVVRHDGALYQNAFEVHKTEALQTQVFDGIVIDWLFGNQTSAAAIRAVRASENPDAAIFVLTGELLTGKASESEISDVIRNYDVACYEKPARMAILVADLSKRLNRA